VIFIVFRIFAKTMLSQKIVFVSVWISRCFKWLHHLC